jgi:hypothetical protein
MAKRNVVASVHNIGLDEGRRLRALELAIAARPDKFEPTVDLLRSARKIEDYLRGKSDGQRPKP